MLYINIIDHNAKSAIQMIVSNTAKFGLLPFDQLLANNVDKIENQFSALEAVNSSSDIFVWLGEVIPWVSSLMKLLWVDGFPIQQGENAV